MSSALLVAVVSLLAVAAGSVVKTNQVQPEGTFELLILHNNDMHARFEQTSQLSGACTTADRDAGKCYGGFPRVAYLVKKAREEAASGQGPPVLYLNAGDTYTGTAWFTIYKWKIAAEFVNALQPDAVSLGNHEFDNGVSGLTPFIEQLSCPVLAANLRLGAEPALRAERNLQNATVFDIDNVKVGVIGYLTPDTKFLAVENNVEYISEIEALKSEVAKMRDAGINIIIALGHSGYLKDLEIAKEVDGLDLVIGGHTNTFLWNGTTPDSEESQNSYPTFVKQASGKSVPVVQAYAYTKYLGQIRMIFDSKGEATFIDGSPILLDNTVPQDPDVLKIVEKYRADVLNVADEILGNTRVLLDGQSCKRKECNLGNMITDAMVFHYASQYSGKYWSDAPIAIIQGGGIRASVDHETLTHGDLLTVMPFQGNLSAVTMNGTILLQMLEHSVADYDSIEDPGEFLQFSGIRVIYRIDGPPGARVHSAVVRCGDCIVPEYNPVEEDRLYKVIMPGFVGEGGDGYTMLKPMPKELLGYSELTSTAEYVRIHGRVQPERDGRIALLRAAVPDSATNLASSIFIMFLSLLYVSLLR